MRRQLSTTIICNVVSSPVRGPSSRGKATESAEAITINQAEKEHTLLNFRMGKREEKIGKNRSSDTEHDWKKKQKIVPVANRFDFQATYLSDCIKRHSIRMIIIINKSRINITKEIKS